MFKFLLKALFFKKKTFIGALFVHSLSLIVLLISARSLTIASTQTLSNGLKLIIEKNQTSKTTAVHILIIGGKLAEPKGKEGLGYLVARLSLDPPDNDHLREFMKTGAEVRISCRGDFLLINIECLSANFETTMKLIYRTFSRPIFSGIRVSGAKKVLTNNQKKEFDDVDSRAELAFLEAYFGDRGYGLSGYGTSASLEAIKGEDATTYHRNYFVGANMVIAVVSDLEPEAIKTIIEATFGRLSQGQRFLASPLSAKIPERKEINLKKEVKLALLAVAFPLPSLSDKNFILANLLEPILGQGPGSKIWPLRLEKRLAYEVGSKLIFMKGGGLLIIYLKTLPQKFSQAKEKLKENLEEIAEKGLSQDDLETGRNAFRLSFYQRQEIKRKRAEALALYSFWGLENEPTSLLDAINWEEFSSYFKSIFDLDKAVFLSISPEAEEGGFERNLLWLPF